LSIMLDQAPRETVAPGPCERPAWLTVDEVANALRLPVSTAYDLVRKKVIPSTRLGRHIRIPAGWLLGLTATAQDGAMQERPGAETKPMRPRQDERGTR
jgi:excisionase family DNA binding protein